MSPRAVILIIIGALAVLMAIAVLALFWFTFGRRDDAMPAESDK